MGRATESEDKGEKYRKSIARPDDIPWQDIFDMKTQNVTPEMAAKLDALQMDPRGLSKFRDEALRTGPSAWARLMAQKQAYEQMGAGDEIGKQAQARTAEARTQLAMRGGLTGGARERLARSGARNYLDMSQDMRRQGSQNRLQIGVNDEQNRVSQLGQLPGMEAQALQPGLAKAELWGKTRQGDVANQMANAKARQDFIQNQYNKKMEAWGAAQTAGAQADSGGSMFICTALREDGLMSAEETREMTNFMLKGVLPRADFYAWYFRRGKEAIALARRQNFDFSKIKHQFVDEILATLAKEGVVAAQNEYGRKAGQFCTQFLGLCGYDTKFEKTGFWKSLLSLPSVFSLPNTWVWAYQYARIALRRQVRTMRARLA